MAPNDNMMGYLRRLAEANDISELPTYSVYYPGYTAYATPTDLISLSGAAGKLVIPFAFGLLINTTAAGRIDIDFIRRSTLNTGGTPTARTAFKLDSSEADPAAVFNSYGAAPSLGTANGTLVTAVVTSTVLTSPPGVYPFTSLFGSNVRPSTVRPLVLRENEMLVANFRGAALPGGFTATVYGMWVEIDAD